jgi:hypothetical protein
MSNTIWVQLVEKVQAYAMSLQDYLHIAQHANAMTAFLPRPKYNLKIPPQNDYRKSTRIKKHKKTLGMK